MVRCSMNNFADMLWIESRKAIRSKMPLWTALGSLFLPFGIGFLIFVSKNQEIAHRLGLISAKADLVAYAGTDWKAYLGLFGQLVAAGGYLLYVLAISWVFGREFVDGTLKDILAVPVRRASILAAKFLVTILWSAGLSLIIFTVGMALGAALRLPGGSPGVLFQGSLLYLSEAGLTIVVVIPFAFLASLGRGYLLSISMAALALMMANFVALAGWGEYFPWAVPGLLAQGTTPLTFASYAIVLLTGLAGLVATYLWWKYADQSH